MLLGIRNRNSVRTSILLVVFLSLCAEAQGEEENQSVPIDGSSAKASTLQESQAKKDTSKVQTDGPNTTQLRPSDIPPTLPETIQEDLAEAQKEGDFGKTMYRNHEKQQKKKKRRREKRIGKGLPKDLRRDLVIAARSGRFDLVVEDEPNPFRAKCQSLLRKIKFW